MGSIFGKNEKFENMWDLRTPSMHCWWEGPTEFDEKTNFPILLKKSSSARRAVGNWLSSYKKSEDTNRGDSIISEDTSAIIKVENIDEEDSIKRRDSVSKEKDTAVVRIDNIHDEPIVKKYSIDTDDIDKMYKNIKNNPCKCNRRQRLRKDGVSTK